MHSQCKSINNFDMNKLPSNNNYEDKYLTENFIPHHPKPIANVS